ncbi:MAG: hypothetical protein ACTSYA_11680 [Candidatus Kariarchaeaceae archaeon]
MIRYLPAYYSMGILNRDGIYTEIFDRIARELFQRSLYERDLTYEELEYIEYCLKNIGIETNENAYKIRFFRKRLVEMLLTSIKWSDDLIYRMHVYRIFRYLDENSDLSVGYYIFANNEEEIVGEIQELERKYGEGGLDLILKTSGLDITGERKMEDLNWLDYRSDFILDKLSKFDIDTEQREVNNEGKTRYQIKLEEEVENKKKIFMVRAVQKHAELIHKLFLTFEKKDESLEYLRSGTVLMIKIKEKLGEREEHIHYLKAILSEHTNWEEEKREEEQGLEIEKLERERKVIDNPSVEGEVKQTSDECPIETATFVVVDEVRENEMSKEEERFIVKARSLRNENIVIETKVVSREDFFKIMLFLLGKHNEYELNWNGGFQNISGLVKEARFVSEIGVKERGKLDEEDLYETIVQEGKGKHLPLKFIFKQLYPTRKVVHKYELFEKPQIKVVYDQETGAPEKTRIKEVIALYGQRGVKVLLDIKESERTQLFSIWVERNNELFFDKEVEISGSREEEVDFGFSLKSQDKVKVVVIEKTEKRISIELTSMEVTVKKPTDPEIRYLYQVRNMLGRFDINIDLDKGRELLKILENSGRLRLVKQLIDSLSNTFKPEDLMDRLALLQDGSYLPETFFKGLAKELEVSISPRKTYLQLGKLIPEDIDTRKPEIKEVIKLISGKGDNKVVLLEEKEPLAHVKHSTFYEKWSKMMTNPVFENSEGKKIEITFYELPFITTFFLRNGFAHHSPLMFIYVSGRQDWYNTAISNILSVVFWVLYQMVENEDYRDKLG